MTPEAFLSVTRFCIAPMLLVEASGIIVAVSPAFLKSTGVAKSGLIGKSLADILAADKSRVEDFILQCSRMSEPIPGRFRLLANMVDYIFEGGLARPGSDQTPALLIFRMRTAAETGKGFVALNQKIAELSAEITLRKGLESERANLLAAERKARAEAEKANRAKDEFLAAVSHELRTPMGTILGWLALLEEGSVDPSEFSGLFTKLYRTAKQQAQLIEDVLDVSRIVTGKLRLNLEAIDAALVIERAVDIVRPTADAKQVDLYVSASQATGRVSGDPDRLQQAVWNLLMNAIKFTPKGGKVFVACKRRDSKVLLTVADEGEGIDPLFLPHVFERFLQEDGAKTRIHGGLGLGLAIVRHIVELHGGTITASSAGKGRGAAFAVELPVLAVDVGSPGVREPALTAGVEKAAVPAAKCDFPTLSGMRILVVDDAPDARELISRVLKQRGADVLVAGSVGEALALLDQAAVDVLISDIGMPHQTGFDLIRSVRVHSNMTCRQTPAVALTAFATKEDRDQTQAAGFQEHLTKPVNLARLVQVVAALGHSPAAAGAGRSD